MVLPLELVPFQYPFSTLSVPLYSSKNFDFSVEFCWLGWQVKVMVLLVAEKPNSMNKHPFIYLALGIVFLILLMLAFVAGIEVGQGANSSEPNYQAWAVVGTWFAGIATLLVVIHSVYLTHKKEFDDQERLDGRVGGSTSPNAKEDKIFDVNVWLVSLGNIPARISFMTWSSVEGRPPDFIALDYRTAGSDFKRTLDKNEAHVYHLSTPDPSILKWKADADLGGDVEKLRLKVHTTTQEILFKLPENLLEVINNATPKNPFMVQKTSN